MPTRYQIKDQEQLHFITLQVVEWVDIFTRLSYRDIVIENLRYCQEHKGLQVYAYVIMSNHIHLLVRSLTAELSKTLRDFKSYTAKQILQEIESSGESRRKWMLAIFREAAKKHARISKYQFWTHKNHAECIDSNKFIRQKLDYIHYNPVKAEIVTNPEEYRYSSAANYAGELGLLNVEVLTTQWKTYT